MFQRVKVPNQPDSGKDIGGARVSRVTGNLKEARGKSLALCANILLNELDHELERRGHSFVRYEDDMVIFCGSKASAEQTLEHIVPFIEKKLFLKVNREKTVVVYAGKIKFLGYGFYKGKNGFTPNPRRR